MTASRWVLHVDLDQFIAAVELLRRPELRGRPVVVGGDGDPTRPRQVVATASYEAREFGVGSGMPLRRAARLCPEAVFLPADRDAYDDASAVVMATLRELPVEPPAPVEVLGWDEAFVGSDTDEPRALAELIRERVLAETELTCAVGIGDNKLRAKTATGFAKPGGIAQLTAADWLPVMGQQPTEALWGIGAKTAAKLADRQITTVAALAAADHRELAGVFGPTTGPWLVALGRGLGGREVHTEPWLPKSRSRETTFPTDLTDPAEIRAEVGRLARQVARDVLAQDERPVVRVGVKIRFRPFVTRSHAVPVTATRDPAAIERAALAALAWFADGEGGLDRPVRLLGVRAEPDSPES